MLKIDALETGYGKKQVLFGLSLEVWAGETVGSQPHRWWQCGTQINLPEDHLQKLQDNFKGNIRVSTVSVRLQKTPHAIEPHKCPQTQPAKV
jgi:hypothetical protein